MGWDSWLFVSKKDPSFMDRGDLIMQNETLYEPGLFSASVYGKIPEISLTI